MKKVGKIFAHFNHDEPRKMRYRIDVSHKNEDYETLEQEGYIKFVGENFNPQYIDLK